MKIIDNRLLDAKSEQQLIENFNRTLNIIDTLASVVSDMDDSQLYKVSFDTDGGSPIPNQYVVSGEKAEQPTDPTRDGYYLDGWYNGNVEYDFDTPVTSHLTLKAKWTPDLYEILYDLDGGEFPEGVTVPANYTIETDTFTLPVPEKEGYEFRGWTGSNGTIPNDTVTISKGSTGTKDYTANWAQPTTYTITFYTDEGGSTVYTTQTVPERGHATEPTPPTREGYTFDYWYYMEDVPFDFDMDIDTNYDLYGHWTSESPVL